MTQKELELEFQKLNLEYTKKKNDIARRKEEVNQRKLDALLESDDAYHAEKRARLAKISVLRTEKAALEFGSIKRAQLEAECRNLDAELSVLRDDNERRKHSINHAAYAERRELDEKLRLANEWYEFEKSRLMKEYSKEGYLDATA